MGAMELTLSELEPDHFGATVEVDVVEERLVEVPADGGVDENGNPNGPTWEVEREERTLRGPLIGWGVGGIYGEEVGMIEIRGHGRIEIALDVKIRFIDE